MPTDRVRAYAERLHPRVEAAYRGDEDRAQELLYGSPRQDVTRLDPDHPPTVKDDDAPASTGRVA
jgi:hypothetical protein